MKQSKRATVVHLDDITPIKVAGVSFQPLRRSLGVRSFGINAYSATAVGNR